MTNPSEPPWSLDADDELPETRDRTPAVFPWSPVLVVLLVVAVHLTLVFLMASQILPRRELIAAGALAPGATLEQPWRLVTSIFLHVSPSHVLWNGVSMLVFAVPLLVNLNHGKTWTIYLAAGAGGGVAALQFNPPETVIIGSSGAVAGLFGAWAAQKWRQARTVRFGWRDRVRAVGISLLVLPSLLTPTTASGHRVSVASHLGGLSVGILLGLVLSGRRDDEGDMVPPEGDPNYPGGGSRRRME